MIAAASAATAPISFEKYCLRRLHRILTIRQKWQVSFSLNSHHSRIREEISQATVHNNLMDINLAEGGY